jgi:hypothetical protein
MYETVLSPSASQLPGADPCSVDVNFSLLRLTPLQYVIHTTATELEMTCYMILDG